MESQDGAELCFPQLLNTSCRKPTAQSNAVFLNILLVSVSVLTVFLNLLVVISVSHFRQLHTPTNILLLSLAVSDFLVGLLLMPGEIFRLTTCWFLGDVMCSLYKYLSCIVYSTSIGDMVLISVDRYVAVSDPLHYPTRVTVRRVKLSVCLCWLYYFFYSGLYLKNDLTQPDRYNSCYAVTLQRSVTLTTKKSELKAARTLGVLVLGFLMCFCPYYCVSLAGDSVFNGSSASYVVFLYYFNSCLNPVIYALFYPWFRKSVKLVVTLQILQTGSCEANVQ
uniref:trace amine-associated receptor 4-like n=1 Tax=Monopterus albus TaxID=43700 RepID=UPI0009B3CDBF|nr:trace amine-associated receptor 4-like [Monopterus albus]